MTDIEELLYKKKDEIEMLEIPDNMEQKLRGALSKKCTQIPIGWVASILIFVLIFSYSFDTLAYYGKKFVGYDEIMNASIKTLNEEGRGQEINKSCVFSNGVEVTLSGIMFDDKELVALIKIHSAKDRLEQNLPLYDLRGIKPLGYNMKSGSGIFVDDYTAVFTQSFEVPSFYEKWMKVDVKYFVNGKLEIQSIPFTLNRNKAIKKEVTKNIGKQVQIEDYNIKFESISASGMSTNIYGRIIPLNENAAKVFTENNNFKGLEAPNIAFDLIANDDEIIQSTGRSRNSSTGNISFINGSEALPKDLRRLQIKNIRMEYLKIIDKEAEVTLKTTNKIITDDIIVKKVELEGDIVNITISSKGIPVIGAFQGENQLEQTNPDEFKYEGRSNILVDRVYKFKGKGENLKLLIKNIRYSDITDMSIEIQVD